MTTAVKHEPLTDLVWMEHLPRLEITSLKSTADYGRCKHTVEYLVRSNSKLSEDDFQWFLDKGILMKGQLFNCFSTYDGTEKVSGRWTVNGKEWVPFYEYHVMCMVDSSD